MKKLFSFSLLLLLLLSGSLAAQTYSIYVCGSVVDSVTNNPVPNHSVTISYSTMGYSGTVVTDGNGNFCDTIPNVPSSTTQGTITLTTVSCNTLQTMSVPFSGSPMGTFVTVTMAICTPGGGSQTCIAGFSHGSTAFGTTFTSSSSGAQTYFWDFGDGNTSTQANPTHVYATAGTYTACLIITCASGADTTCSTVTISGGGNNCIAGFNNSNTGLMVGFTSTSSGAQSYFWDFGDGATSTQFNPTHSYAASGTYNVCLVITCSSGNDSSCANITVSNSGGPGSSNISGTVLIPNTGMGTPATQAEVYLIVFDTANGGTLTAVDTTFVNPSGMFTFSNVVAGDYLIKAALLPSSTNFSGYLPTYYTSSLFWNSATTLNVSANAAYTTSILLIAGNNPGGPGFVGGLVSQGANKTAGPGDPVEHAQVMILDLQDNPVQYTYTNANGEFNFSNLAYGTYQVYIEEWGKTTTPYQVTLSAQTPGAIDLHFHVNTASIALYETVKPTMSSEFNLYPVPVKEQATLEFSLEQAGTISLQVLNSNGQVTFDQTKGMQPGNHQLSLDFQGLAPGIYLVKFSNGADSQVRKILKK